MPVGKPTLNNAVIRHALRSLHAGNGAANADRTPCSRCATPAYGEREQVEHVALLIKNTGTCSTCTVSQNHPYVIAGIIIITVMPGLWAGHPRPCRARRRGWPGQPRP